MVSCQLLLQMVEEIAFENGRISNFERLATLALTLNRVMLHTVVRHSSTSTYTPNFIEILWTDGRTYTHTRTEWQTFETGFIWSTLSKSQPKNPSLVRDLQGLVSVKKIAKFRGSV